MPKLTTKMRMVGSPVSGQRPRARHLYNVYIYMTLYIYIYVCLYIYIYLFMFVIILYLAVCCHDFVRFVAQNHASRTSGRCRGARGRKGGEGGVPPPPKSYPR